MAEEAEKTLIGTVVLDRFRLTGQLGAGGMGTVYQAEHINLGSQHAVKALRGFVDLPPELYEQMELRFLREAKICASIRHPNLVAVTDFGTSDGCPYLIMEYVAGRDLTAIIEKDGPFNETQALKVLRDVADAIGALHEHGVIHRDLKPPNVMIEKDTGRVVLMDLGIAKDTASSTQMTQNILGTPAYMAPEQMIDAAKAGPASDVYSLGATFFAILAGKDPFSAGNPLALLQLAREQLFMHGSLAGVAKKRDKLEMTPQVESLLHDMTRYEVAQRIGDTKQIVERVNAILGDSTTGTQHTISPEAASSSNAETLLALPGQDPVPTPISIGRKPGTGQGQAPAPRPKARRALTALAGASGGGEQSAAPRASTPRARTQQPAAQPASKAPWILVGIVIIALVAGGVIFLPSYRNKTGSQNGSQVSPTHTSGTGVTGGATPTQVGQTQQATTPTPPPEPALDPKALPPTYSLPVQGARAMELVKVMPGTFRIGSEDGAEDERPTREITLTKPFYIGRYEVTVGQFVAFLNHGGYTKKMRLKDMETAGIIRRDKTYEAAGDDVKDQPIVTVSHEAARAFCKWLTKTNPAKLTVELPGEVEWEYAARGPQSRVYPWGDEWEDGRCHAGDEDGPTAVGSYPDGKSWCGAEDMSGNVWEWCADRYEKRRYVRLRNKNPSVKGAGNSRDLRVVRGGGYGNDDYICRASYRNGMAGNQGDRSLGFRVKLRASRAMLLKTPAPAPPATDPAAKENQP